MLGGYYRLILPLKKMAEVCGEYVEIQLMQNPLGADKEKKQFIPNWDFYEMKWADVIMISNINNYGGPYTLEIVKKGHELGKFVHFDTDDLLTELYEEHRLYGVYKDNQLDKITKVMYHNSHLVTVTQEFFASKIKEFVRAPLAIIRNAIDYNLPCWNVPKIPSKQVRVGWAGGIHHRPDVKVFAGIPHLVNQKVGKENVIWDFYGHPPNDLGKEDDWQRDAWKEYINSFLVGIKKSSGPPNYRIHFALPPDSYGSMYANMDISIAPLKDNLFNQSKSDIKVSEASRYKIPLIATDVGCYRDTIKNGKTGYLLPPNASAAEWSKVLVKVIKDKQHRIALGENLHNSVNHLFDINITIWDRLNLYLEVFKILNWKFKND